ARIAIRRARDLALDRGRALDARGLAHPGRRLERRGRDLVERRDLALGLDRGVARRRPRVGRARRRAPGARRLRAARREREGEGDRPQARACSLAAFFGSGFGSGRGGGGSGAATRAVVPSIASMRQLPWNSTPRSMKMLGDWMFPISLAGAWSSR